MIIMMNERVLKEEQEKILERLTQILPESSQETYVSDAELLEIAERGGTCAEASGAMTQVSKRRKPRRKCSHKTKRRKVRPSRESEVGVKRGKRDRDNDDSCLGASLPKSNTPGVCGSGRHPANDSDSDESVSLLQRAEVKDDRDDAGISLAWNVKVFPSSDDEDDGEGMSKVDKSSQTVIALPKAAEDELRRNLNFVRSVVRLRHIFSSRESIPAKKLADIIAGGGLSGRRSTTTDVNVSHETVHYVMRTSNVSDVTERSVDCIVSWLRQEMDKDLATLCDYWESSVREDAADVLNRAVDSDEGPTRRKVSDFLRSIVDGMGIDEHQDSAAEYKTLLLSGLCRSVHLQYDLIEGVQTKLERFAETSRCWETRDAPGRLATIASVKVMYFLLRLLEDLFRSFRGNLDSALVEGFVEGTPRHRESNVLEMWRRNWRISVEGVSCSGNARETCVGVVAKWLHRSDEMLRFSARHCPILTGPAQKCALLAHDLLSRIRETAQPIFGADK